jgi:protein phosphatase
MYNFEAFGKTDQGLVRTNNEDVFVVKPDVGVYLVADGMGGAAAGELASKIFSEAALELFSDAASSQMDLAERVQRVFGAANDRIIAHTEAVPAHRGMGCTAELMVFSESGFIIGHMGDSRTYRLKNGNLKQLTQDHSLVQEQVNNGLITPSEAKKHPMRNVILRAVGVDESPSLDLIRGTVSTGDMFLLCSDGLTDLVEDDAIEEVLRKEAGLGQKTDILIELAKAGGGRDNITVVLIQIT